MALSALLRNTSKCNISNFIKVATASRQIPLKTYFPIVLPQQNAFIRPFSLTKNALLMTTRNVSISAPRRAAAGENHTTLWTIERILSAGLLAIIPAAFLVPSQTSDVLLATSVVLHTYWGIEAIIVDYMRPSVVGNVLPKVAHVTLIILSIASWIGLCYLTLYDVGLANGIKKFWAIQGQSSDELISAEPAQPTGP